MRLPLALIAVLAFLAPKTGTGDGSGDASSRASQRQAKPQAKPPYKQQRQLPTPRVTGKRKRLPSTEPALGREIHVARQGIEVDTIADSRFSADHAAALSSFSLGYLDRGHLIRRIGMHWGADGEVISAMLDRDGGARYQFGATYLDLPGIPRKSTDFGHFCQKVCDVPIEKPNGDEQFVLTGFLFHRTTAAGPIHRIAIRPLPDRGVVRVELDDGAPISDAGEFKPWIHYAYVPTTKTAGTFAASSRANASAVALPAAGAANKRMLHGFDLQFSATARPLEKISVESQSQHYRTELSDSNGDDTTVVAVDWVLLR